MYRVLELRGSFNKSPQLAESVYEPLASPVGVCWCFAKWVRDLVILDSTQVYRVGKVYNLCRVYNLSG